MSYDIEMLPLNGMRKASEATSSSEELFGEFCREPRGCLENYALPQMTMHCFIQTARVREQAQACLF